MSIIGHFKYAKPCPVKPMGEEFLGLRDEAVGSLIDPTSDSSELIDWLVVGHDQAASKKCSQL